MIYGSQPECMLEPLEAFKHAEALPRGVDVIVGSMV